MPGIKVEYAPDEAPFSISMITPELRYVFEYVIKHVQEPANLDDALETLESLSDEDLSEICKSGDKELRENLMSALDEVDIRFGANTHYWQQNIHLNSPIQCDFLVELLGGKVKES